MEILAILTYIPQPDAKDFSRQEVRGSSVIFASGSPSGWHHHQKFPQDRIHAGEKDLHDPHRARGHFDILYYSRIARSLHADGDDS